MSRTDVEVTLRTMSEAEYAHWHPRMLEGYAQEHVESMGWTIEEARDRAATQTDQILPDGVRTPGQHLLVAESQGRQVGILWLWIHRERRGTEAWVYDVEVAEGLRGRGFGRAIMLAAEAYARAHDAVRLGLNVFGANQVARGLYDSLGYQVTATNMAKELDPDVTSAPTLQT